MSETAAPASQPAGDAPWPEPDFSKGLVPAVVQDVATGQVRMLAYMNEEAYRRTRATGLVTLWSRSRNRLWQKGATSGNVLRVRRVLADCDSDALLVLAQPDGPTCHTGSDSCFGEAPVHHPAGGGRALEILEQLEGLIARRDRERPAGSYTASLLAGGPSAAGRKVAEEALESVFAAAFESPERLAEEAADLLYHLLVLLRSRGVALEVVAAALARRR
ncbi:MAG: bifunctional phosphoribosyl-AMP cyclohydrolase/phosphoribosyl-ATP diphosphatase HisIE [Gemmatimonadetes bacterium]|nr:bifunctional phosphoribosyl-AMP cyclohydrolase/phosphoribosyl-ATP diphosphatase HisIE [Gemmatimonadota bacterium]